MKSRNFSLPAAVDHVLVIEPVRHGEEHQPFDTTLLMTCAAAFPMAKITFVAEERHLEVVRSALTDLAGFDFVPTEIAARHASGLKRFRADWEVVRGVLSMIREKRPKTVIFSSITREILWALKVLSWRQALPPVLGILHAGLLGALRRPRFNLMARIQSLRFAMISAGKVIRFVVLEQSILDSITARDAELASGISVFPHPLPPDLLDEPPSRSIDPDAPIKIGLLGLCTPQKGLFRFLELAKYAKSSQVNRLEFEIIGRLHKDVISRAEPYMQYLHRPPANKIMPREEFVAAAANLHFAVFLFDGNYYNVTASGVLLDCIALGVPVIADSSELIHRLESKVGPIGLTDADYFTSEALIGHLKNLDHAIYRNYWNNMISIRPSRSPEALAQVLRAIVGLPDIKSVPNA